jgi:hypothetical protein
MIGILIIYQRYQIAGYLHVDYMKGFYSHGESPGTDVMLSP